MTQAPDNGGPAFPTPQDEFGKNSPSMSLRDYFAGQALAGLASGHDEEGVWSWTPDVAADTAYKVADAMLAARNRSTADE